MAEAGIWIFIAAAVSLGIVTGIQFAERAHRYRRLAGHWPAGTYGFKYELSHIEVDIPEVLPTPPEPPGKVEAASRIPVKEDSEPPPTPEPKKTETDKEKDKTD